MSIKVARSANGPDFANELKSELGNPSVVVYFASSRMDPAAVAGSVAKAFPGSKTFGCTTAGELVSGSMSKDSIVAMGIGSDVVSNALVTTVPNVAAGTKGIDAAFSAWEKELGTKMLDLDPERWIGIVLVDGLSGAEERVMERIGDLTNVTFIGGSAGDDLAFTKTHVAAHGMASSGSAVLALFECPRGFDIIKTQSFHATRKYLVPTKVDKASREVIEFDGKPAARAYAEALGVAPKELSNQFMSHPLGLMVGGEPYVRSPQQIIGETVRFYCGVDEGVKLAVLDSTDIVKETASDLEAACTRNGGAAGLLNFNCILRTLELEAKGQTEAYGKVFDAVPTAGFSTYGEEYLGHINQTATMLLFR
jgi:hypothetical protein